jgi:YVTN family beta-propeller protein
MTSPQHLRLARSGRRPVLTVALAAIWLTLIACSPTASTGASTSATSGSQPVGAAQASPVVAPAVSPASVPVSVSPVASPAAAASPGFASGPKAYVGLFKDNAVAVLDTATNRVLRTIAVPTGPHGLVITPDGRKVYVSSDGASTVSVIDAGTDQIVTSIEVGPTPHGLTISPNGQQILVSGFGANQAEVIDTATDQVTARMPVAQPHNSAISPDGKLAFVGSQQQGATALVMLGLVAGSPVGTIPLDKTPRALAISPDGKRLYLTLAGSDTVQVLDPASRQLIGQIPVGASPHHPSFTPDGTLGLVVSQGPGELSLINPVDNVVLSTLKVGAQPHWIATSSDGRLAYVTNEGSNDLSVVDLIGRTVLTTVPVGAAPRKVAVQPGPSAPLAGAAVPSAAPAAVPSPASSADHGSKDVRGLDELELEADDYYFEPTVLQGAPGQKLKLTVSNEASMLHNFSLPTQGIDRDIRPAGQVEVEVAFPASGALRFYCKFHQAQGMTGELRAGQ